MTQPPETPLDTPLDTPLADLPRLVARYARERAVEPIRGAGRWMAWGIVGATMLAVALVMASLAVVRLAQRWDALDGTWSFVPHLAGALAAAVGVSAAVSRIRVGSLRREA